MAKYVKVDVICPCGYRLKTRQSNAESGSSTSFTKVCPSCKKTVGCTVRGANAYTGYK